MRLESKNIPFIFAFIVLTMPVFFLGACSSADVVDEFVPQMGGGEFVPTTELIQNNPSLIFPPLPDDTMAYIHEGAVGGHGLDVRPLYFNWDWERDGEWDGVIQLESLEEELLVALENISVYGHNFVMKVFVNYETVPFLVRGEEEFKESFMFSIASGYEAMIPFVIDFNSPQEDATYQLTVAIFGDPERHMIEGDAHWNFEYSNEFGAIVERHLTFGSGGDVALGDANTEPIASRENQGFVAININTDLNVDDFYATGHAYPPVRTLQVHAGEEIKFAWFVNTVIVTTFEEGVLTADNYVVVGLLDWEQIPLNGKPYLFVDATDDEFERRVDFGHLTITAPDEVGLYDFVAFLAPNPTQLCEFLFPLETSIRITIEVVE